MNTMGSRIAARRKEKGMTQEELAAKLGVSAQAVSKWENDLSSPDTIHLIRLADVLDTEVEFLATGKTAELETVEKVVTVVQHVDRIVEKPIVIQKVVEVEKPQSSVNSRVKKVVRTKFVRNPLEFAAIGLICFIFGLILGIII